MAHEAALHRLAMQAAAAPQGAVQQATANQVSAPVGETDRNADSVRHPGDPAPGIVEARVARALK